MRWSGRNKVAWSTWAGVALALTVGGACSTGHAARLGLGFDADGQYADASRFRAVVTQGGLGRVIQGSSMGVTARGTDHVAVHREGIVLKPGEPATVDVHLAVAGGEVAEQVAWTPQDDWDYGISVVVTTRRPEGFCFRIAHATPLPAAAGAVADTMYVIHSGLPKGAIC